MNIVDITHQTVRNLGGSFMVAFDYIVTDPIGMRKQGASSIAVSQEDAIPSQIHFNLEKKLGYKSFTVNHFKEAPKRPTLGLKA